MLNEIRSKEFWLGLLEVLSSVVSLYLLLAGVWVGIVEHDYAQGAFLLILSYLGRGK